MKRFLHAAPSAGIASGSPGSPLGLHALSAALLLLLAATLSLAACSRRIGTAAGATTAGHAETAPAPAEKGASGLATYVNREYGFSLELPAHLHPEAFAGPWSVETFTGHGGRAGTPVVSIAVFSVNHGGVATGRPYPLFFYAEVRVGVSSNTADCYQSPPSGPASPAAHDEIIGGVTFKAVPVGDAGMMKYLNAVSYRVVHSGRCYAVEQIARGSSYRDSSMKPGLTKAQLDAYYREASVIAHSFRFVTSSGGAPSARAEWGLP